MKIYKAVTKAKVARGAWRDAGGYAAAYNVEMHVRAVHLEADSLGSQRREQSRKPGHEASQQRYGLTV